MPEADSLAVFEISPEIDIFVVVEMSPRAAETFVGTGVATLTTSKVDLELRTRVAGLCKGGSMVKVFMGAKSVESASVKISNMAKVCDQSYSRADMGKSTDVYQTSSSIMTRQTGKSHFRPVKCPRLRGNGTIPDVVPLAVAISIYLRATMRLVPESETAA